MSLKPTEIVTDPCRIAFPSLFKMKPKAVGSDKESYQAVVLLPPETDMKPFVEAIKAAIAEKWGQATKLSPGKNPLKSCAEKDNLEGYEEGWHFINTHTGYRPQVVDQSIEPVIDEKLFKMNPAEAIARAEETVYAGCWCRFHLRAYAWEHKQGGKGVSFSLEAVQKYDDGEPFSGRKSAADLFEPVEVEAACAADERDSGDLDALFS